MNISSKILYWKLCNRHGTCQGNEQMKEYLGEYKGKKYKVGFEVSFRDPSDQLYATFIDLHRIAYNVYIYDDGFVPINQLNQFDSLSGNEEVYIKGSFDIRKNELYIENIQRGFIIGGQNFTVNTINQLLTLEPRIKSLYLANIILGQTLTLLKEYNEKGLSLESVSNKERKPLISAMDQCGFTDLEIALEDTAYYGIRGFRL